MSCITCESTDIYAKNKCKKCYMKEYNKAYKERIKEDVKKYRKENRKYYNIYNWKNKGLIDSHNDNYEKIYQRYIDTTNCDLCNIVLTTDIQNTSTTKSMEHNHQTGLFRNIVCHKCNMKLRDIETPSQTNTGFKNIYYCKSRKKYVYNKLIDYKRYQKTFKTIGGALAHKIIHNVLLNHH